DVDATGFQFSERFHEKADIGRCLVEPIVDHDIERDAVKIVPKRADGTGISLIGPEGPDLIFLEEDVGVDIGTVYPCVRKIRTPSAEGRAGLALGPHG